MSFEAWSLGESDPGRTKRLVIGYSTAIVVCAVAGIVGASIKAQAPVEEEEIVAVELTPTVEAPKPPPPPPPALAAPKAPSPPGPKHKPITTPVEVPKEAPAEADPNKAKGTDQEYGEGTGEGSGNGVPGGVGTGPAVAPPPPPPPPPPKAAGPIQLPEDGTPPSPISKPQPPYPEDLKSEGIEGTVVVRFVVTEAGDVSSITVVRGHPRLDPIVISTVKTWKFKPAVVAGHPVATFQVARFNFKIKT